MNSKIIILLMGLSQINVKLQKDQYLHSTHTLRSTSKDLQSSINLHFLSSIRHKKIDIILTSLIILIIGFNIFNKSFLIIFSNFPEKLNLTLVRFLPTITYLLEFLLWRDLIFDRFRRNFFLDLLFCI
jgi:hypothetical protein